jgi:hypothetical protein
LDALHVSRGSQTLCVLVVFCQTTPWRQPLGPWQHKHKPLPGSCWKGGAAAKGTICAKSGCCSWLLCAWEVDLAQRPRLGRRRRQRWQQKDGSKTVEKEKLLGLLLFPTGWHLVISDQRKSGTSAGSHPVAPRPPVVALLEWRDAQLGAAGSLSFQEPYRVHGPSVSAAHIFWCGPLLQGSQTHTSPSSIGLDIDISSHRIQQSKRPRPRLPLALVAPSFPLIAFLIQLFVSLPESFRSVSIFYLPSSSTILATHSPYRTY